MLHGDPGALVDDFRDPLAMAVAGIALVAQQAKPWSRAGERRELIELRTRLRRREVRLIDHEQLGEVAAACRQSAFLGRAEAAQMQVVNSALVEPGGELSLGEAGSSRCRDRAHVDQKADLRAGEFIENGAGRCLLIADRE